MDPNPAINRIDIRQTDFNNAFEPSKKCYGDPKDPPPKDPPKGWTPPVVFPVNFLISDPKGEQRTVFTVETDDPETIVRVEVFGESEAKIEDGGKLIHDPVKNKSQL